MAIQTGGLLRLMAVGMVIALAACSAVERPSAPSASVALPPPPAAGPGEGAPVATASAAPSATSGATVTPPAKSALIPISIAPVTGTPGGMRYALEDDLKKYALTRNFTVVPVDDPGAIYRLKGRISAVGDTSGGLLVYVWDVMDASGTRVHRIAGQQVAAAAVADPWAGVSVTNIDDAARETIDGLADWVRGLKP
jgi:hypothetical protein